ncbi:MAG: biosynthetic-type acetolactate synthase large subunit [Clostridia bacterium]|nr:biosynthetic-type acetolactate synthase large subunit [Clostridia bacterium]
MKLNGSEILTEVLIEQGVDTVFGYPGGAVLNIYDALYKYSDKIKHILSAHEQGASHAADGYARATGKTGVCIATSGPGATNLVTGIATAYMDSVPMVVITGNVGKSLIGRDAFQEVYITGITMPITKHNYMVQDVEELADTIREAFRIANSGRKGPVLIDITKDVTAAVTDFERKEKIEIKDDTVINVDELKTVADIINKANKPVIMFGGGVVSSNASELALELVEKANIPSCHTLMSAGVIGYNNPLNLGLLGMHGSFTTNKAVDDADVLIAIGTRFSDRVALDTNEFAKKATIIQIDIDLSEINKNVAVDHYVIGDVKKVLEALLPMIKKNDRSDWLKTIDTYKAVDYKPVDDDSQILPHQLIGAICDMAGEDTVVVTDVGQHQMWAAQYVHHVNPRGFLTSGGLGTMGYGYGAAIGAKAALGDSKKVVHITGDGSFHMNLNEACTAVSYELPVITVIMNNKVLGMVRQWQRCFYGKRFSQTDPHRKTDFVKLAEGFGAKGYYAETIAEFKTAFAEALKANGPVWIECAIDKDERVLPMIPAGKTVNDIMMGDCKTCPNQCETKNLK